MVSARQAALGGARVHGGRFREVGKAFRVCHQPLRGTAVSEGHTGGKGCSLCRRGPPEGTAERTASLRPQSACHQVLDDLQKRTDDADRLRKMEAQYNDLHACHTSLIRASTDDKAEIDSLKTRLQSAEQETSQLQELLRRSQIELDKLSEERTTLDIKLEQEAVQFKRQQEALGKLKDRPSRVAPSRPCVSRSSPEGCGGRSSFGGVPATRQPRGVGGVPDADRRVAAGEGSAERRLERRAAVGRTQDRRRAASVGPSAHLSDRTSVCALQDRLRQQLDEASKANVDLQQQIGHLQSAAQRNEERARSSVDGRSELELELVRMAEALRDAEETIRTLEESSRKSRPAEKRGTPNDGNTRETDVFRSLGVH